MPAGLQLLHDAGFKLVMVSNQGGIGLGYTTMAKMRGMNLRLNELLVVAGGPPLDAFAWCGHPPKDECSWRKPNPGMLLAASGRGDVSLKHSYIVGDQTVDVSAGRQAQLKACISVSSGNAVKNQVWKYSDFHAPNFLRAAEAILAMEES